MAREDPEASTRAIVEHIIRDSGRELDRGERGTLHMLVLAIKASRAHLAKAIEMECTSPVRGGESRNFEQRMTTRANRLKTTVEEVARFSGVSEGTEHRDLNGPPLDSRSLLMDSLESVEYRAELAQRGVDRRAAAMETARLRLVNAQQHLLLLERARQAVDATTARLEGHITASTGGVNLVPDSPASPEPDVVDLTDEH